MNKVVLTPLNHKNVLQIAINFRFNEEIKRHLEKLPEIYWSKTHSCFYINYSVENKRKIYHHLQEKGWFVDYNALKGVEIPKKITPQDPVVFSRDQKKLLHKYVSFLRGQRLSESSVRTYYTFIYKLVDFIGDKPLEHIVKRDLELFVEQKIAAKNYAISTHRQCMSAIKHFLELHPEIHVASPDLKRPPKSRYLPTVLSKEEVIRLLTATRNLKHRAILAIIYSSGLRIGELLNLRLRDLDVERRQVFIKNSKGRKDRVVVMAESILPLLHNYIATYKPQEYFAEGRDGVKYHAESIRAFLRVSCRRAGIRKRVTPHCLRHSYATHMLENGIDIRYIQELLGHSKPETTMIYTHVSRKDIMKISSPLDVTLRGLKRAADEQQESPLRIE